jgi:hypothetical protein
MLDCHSDAHLDTRPYTRHPSRALVLILPNHIYQHSAFCPPHHISRLYATIPLHHASRRSASTPSSQCLRLTRHSLRWLPPLPGAICAGTLLYQAISASAVLSCPALSASAPSSCPALSALVAISSPALSASAAPSSPTLSASAVPLSPTLFSVGGPIIPDAIQRRWPRYPRRYSASAVPLSPALFSVGGPIIPSAIQRRWPHDHGRYLLQWLHHTSALSALMVHYSWHSLRRWPHRLSRRSLRRRLVITFSIPALSASSVALIIIACTSALSASI